MILVYGAVVIDKHDVYIRFHVAMLKTIIQDDYFRFFRKLHELFDSTYSVCVYGYDDFWKFIFYLHGFIPDVVCRRGFRGQNKTGRLPFIPSTEAGYTVIIFQLVDQGFRVRGFPRSTHGDISHTNNRNVKLMDL